MMRLLLAAWIALACIAAWAKDAPPLAADEAVEKRLVSIAEELRCLVCQNESLAASRADLAVDLRRELRAMIKQGKSDEEIKTFLVERYGDFVLYRPPMKPTTWLLWLGPFVLLAAGIATLFVYLRRRGRVMVEAALSDEETRRAEELLKEDGP